MIEKDFDLAQIVLVYNILDGINEDLNIPYTIKKLGLSFKAKTQFKISLLKSKLKDLALSAEDARIELIKKYGEEREEGIAITTQENYNQYALEYNNTILNQKHKISYVPFVYEDFDDLNVEVPIEFTDAMVLFFE